MYGERMQFQSEVPWIVCLVGTYSYCTAAYCVHLCECARRYIHAWVDASSRLLGYCLPPVPGLSYYSPPGSTVASRPPTTPQGQALSGTAMVWPHHQAHSLCGGVWYYLHTATVCALGSAVYSIQQGISFHPKA